jgi:hypothetical protein
VHERYSQGRSNGPDLAEHRVTGYDTPEWSRRCGAPARASSRDRTMHASSTIVDVGASRSGVRERDRVRGATMNSLLWTIFAIIGIIVVIGWVLGR